MYIFKHICLLLSFLSIVPNVLMAQSYDFFKESSLSIYEATEALKQSLATKGDGALHTTLYAVQDAAYSGSLQELAALYNQLTAELRLKGAGTLSVESEAAYVTLFLEKMRDCYAAHLDTVEEALAYWEWATHHPYRYTASQLPHKWFKHDANRVDIAHIYAMVCAAREIYSKEFGTVVRLLASRCENKTDAATWLADVQNAVASLLVTTPDKIATSELVMQRLADHENDVVQMIAKVQKPNWFKRNWLPLAVGTAVVGATAYAYMQHKSTVDTMCIDSFNKTKTSFLENCYNPVKSFVGKFFGKPSIIMPDAKDTYTINVPDNRMMNARTETREYWEQASQKYFDEADKKIGEGIAELGKLSTKGQQPSIQPQDLIQKEGIKIETAVLNLKIDAQTVADMQSRLQNITEDIAEPKLKSFSTALQLLGEAFKNITTGILIKGQVIEHDEKRLMLDATQKSEQLNFLIDLFRLIPAYIIVSSTYDGLKGTFNWFTKRDHTVLIQRLGQVEKVLTRTTHTTELSDAEYGRMLHLLTKAYDQVSSKVFSNERIEFLDDLTYIANAQSTVAQKQKTLEAMWRKYRSLEKPA